MLSKSLLIIWSLALASVNAESSSATGTVQTTAITNCHFHGTAQACVDGYGNEGYVEPAPTNTDGPTSYTGCHSHGDEYLCLNEAGEEVAFVTGEDDGEDEHETDSSTVDHSDHTDASITGSGTVQTTAITNCHFHGTAQACVDGYGNEGYVEPAPTNTDGPTSYTGCHSHGDEYLCLNEAGEEVAFVTGEDDGEDDHVTTEVSSSTLTAESSSTASESDVTQVVSEFNSDSGSNNVATSFFMLISCVLLPYLL